MSSSIGEMWKLYIILGVVLGTLGMTMLALGCFICCNKKWKKKTYQEMAEEEETCDQIMPQFGKHSPSRKPLKRDLSLSEKFTIPFLSPEEELPFRIQEVKVTDTLQFPHSPQHKKSIKPAAISREKKSSMAKEEPFRIQKKLSRAEQTLIDQSILQQQTESQTLSRRFHSTTSDHHCKAGLIRFFTEYLTESQILQVTVSNITDLVTKRGNVPVRPFVRLGLSSTSGHRQKKDTSVHKDDANPSFDELIEFKEIDRDGLAHQKLKIKVYSQHSARQKELPGQVDVLMSSLSLYEKEMFDIYLYKQKSTITMTSVSITICHQATFARLEVKIEKARGVPRGATGSSIYGSVTLRKGLTSMNLHTALKNYEYEPEFDETLTFYNINTDSAEPLGTYNLIFTLCERPMMGHDTILGVVVFNMNSPQTSAIRQWISVQAYPHESHPCWHYLVAPEEVGTTDIPRPSYAHRK